MEKGFLPGGKNHFMVKVRGKEGVSKGKVRDELDVGGNLHPSQVAQTSEHAFAYQPFKLIRMVRCFREWEIGTGGEFGEICKCVRANFV